MAFLAPLIAPIAAALNLTPFLGGLLQIAGAFGLNFLAKKLAGKQKQGASGGTRAGLTIDTNASRQCIFGTASTPGRLVYWQLSGSSNKVLQMVVALADHQCDSLVEVWVDGVKKTWDPLTGVVDGYHNNLKIRFYTGAVGQAAASEIITTSSGRWTSTEKGRYVCYATVEATYSEADFPGGIPKILYVVKGASLYDPRSDSTVGGSGSQRWSDPTTWTYSNNSAVVLYNITRGFSAGSKRLLGLSASVDAISLAEMFSAANSCDESVARKAGGTEARYACNGVFNVSESNQSHIERALASMAGELVTSGGLIRIFAGVAQTVVASLTDADLIPAEPLVEHEKRPRSELINAVLGSFIDPSQGWNELELPARTSSIDEATDGGATGPIRLATSLDLTTVTSRSQAQRVMEIQRRRARMQKTVSCVARGYWSRLEAGDWINLTSARRGFALNFEVLQRQKRPGGLIELTLKQADSTVADWTASTDEIDDNQRNDLPSASPTLVAVAGLAVANIIFTAAGGVQAPGLSLTWTPVDDPTVTGIDVEYRRLGDTTALLYHVADATSGAAAILAGIQSGVQYEARMIPVTQPSRGVSFTTWTATGSNASNQVVAVANVSNSAAPGSVTMAGLDAQTQLEIALTTGLQTLQGSVNDRLQTIITDVQSLSLAMLNNWVATGQQGASIKVEQATRQTFYDSYAAYKVTVDASLTGLNSAVSGQASTINALTAQVTAQDGTITSQGSLITGLQNVVTDPVSGNSALAAAAVSLLAGVTYAQTTADSKNANFRQSTTPTALAAGDTWIDTGNGNKLMVATAAGTGGWVSADDARISATVSSLSSLTTAVGNNTTTIGTLSTSMTTVMGWHASWSVTLDVNGYATGYVGIDGLNGITTFGVLANKFVVAQPGVTGGSPVTVFTIGQLNATPGLGFSGNSIFDGTIKVRHLDANDINTLYITGPDGLYYFDFANGRIGSTDGLVTFDIRNKTLDMSADFLLDFRFNYDSMYVPSVMGLQ